jgi:hypothetical protein
VALLDHESEQPDDDTAVQRFRIPRPARGVGGDVGIMVFGAERLICHGLMTMTDSSVAVIVRESGRSSTP